jgi:hypothetical protein
MSTKKFSIIKLVNSPHKTSTYAHKTTPIFTAITHNTPVNSLNQHMFCNLQKIASYPKLNKMGRLAVGCNSAGISNYVVNIIILIWWRRLL